MAKKRKKPIISGKKWAKMLGVRDKTPSEERATWEKQGCQGPCVSSKRQTKGQAIKKALGF